MNNDFEEFEAEVYRAIEWQSLIGHDDVNLSNLLIIEESITELYEAENMVKTRDALCDSIVVACGALAALGYFKPELNLQGYAPQKYGVYLAAINCLHHSSDTSYFDLIDACYDSYGRINFDIAQDLKAVNDSNYSKFTDCPVTAKASCDKYAKQGVNAEFRRLFNGQYGIFAKGNKDIPDGKLLKGINYQEPKL